MIVIEGIDKVGKSTQAQELVYRLKLYGLDAVEYSFPRDGTPTGDLIRRHLKGEVQLTEDDDEFQNSVTAPEDALMFQCLQLVDKYAAASTIKLEEEKGKIVVLTRWTPSSYAYGSDDGISMDWLSITHSYLPIPWVSILLDLDSDEATKRSRGQNLDRLDRDLEKQKRLRTKYLELWGSSFIKNGVIIPANGSIKEVHERIWQSILPLLLVMYPDFSSR